jgi:hypothetical protein
VGMNPLAGAPREHLRHIKIPWQQCHTMVPYNGANNLLVFNTWLTEVLVYCSTYKLTGPARDQACNNVISSALTGNARVWYHTVSNLPDCPNTFRGWILALHARFMQLSIMIVWVVWPFGLSSEVLGILCVSGDVGIRSVMSVVIGQNTPGSNDEFVITCGNRIQYEMRQCKSNNVQIQM